MKTIHIVAGTRPNFVKIAPLYRAFESEAWATPVIVHTGQHYDHDMSDVFFNDLEIPSPHICLNVSGGSHAEQTGKIMMAYEKVLVGNPPDLVVVVGDVNSTVACALTAKKVGVKVAHVEAGLRSRDLAMPEEINRIVTDSIADLFFVTEESGVENLKQEGKKEEDIFLVGNVMIDTLFRQLSKLNGHKHDDRYAVATIHRPSNVDDKEVLGGILDALVEISRDIPIFFPIHPRTRKNMERWNLDVGDAIQPIPPKPYTEFLKLWKDASLVITDSGGLQEETSALGVPCFTVRENTERPATIKQGTNTLVGTKKRDILDAYEKFKQHGPKNSTVPELWDGKAANRIVRLVEILT